MKLSAKEVLKKFKKGETIDSDEEMKILERYALTGMVQFGSNLKTRKAEAILTNQGRWFLGQL